MGTQGKNFDWLPAGMDPKSSYLLEIHLKCNPKKCRKDVSCYRLSKPMDPDVYNFKDLVGDSDVDSLQCLTSHNGHNLTMVFSCTPPLLKSIAGRRRNQRFKGCTEASGSTRPRGKHQCRVCKGYGHRWYNCKDGDPDDIAALLAEKGPPKKKKKTVQTSCESSIVPITQKTMQFPSSQSVSASLGSGHSQVWKWL